MIDHFNLPVRDLTVSRAFYDAVFVALGYGPIGEDGDAVGYGVSDWSFGIYAEAQAFSPIHVAFVASSKATVDLFHATALKVGAVSNGAPGLRPEYGPHYYGAFVIDPDGHNVEAVFRGKTRN